MKIKILVVIAVLLRISEPAFAQGIPSEIGTAAASASSWVLPNFCSGNNLKITPFQAHTERNHNGRSQ
jgi:hypothetical protein